MALLIITSEKERLLFSISFTPLISEMVSKISNHMSTLLAQVKHETQSKPPSQIFPVVVETTQFSASIRGDLLALFTNTPLIIDDRVVGIMGIYNTIPEAFYLENVTFLYELGKKAAEALSRIMVK